MTGILRIPLPLRSGLRACGFALYSLIAALSACGAALSLPPDAPAAAESAAARAHRHGGPLGQDIAPWL